MNYGIVDIGSNTIRLNVYKVMQKSFGRLFTKKYTAGIANYIEDGRLTEKGMKRIEEALLEIKLITAQIEMEQTYVFATASLRKVSNSYEILEYIKENVGTEIELISEREEARLGFIGIQQVNPGDEGISIDIGGGSTEIVKFWDTEPEDIININEGSLSLFNTYVGSILPTQEEMQKIKLYIRGILGNYRVTQKYPTMIGIGGTVRAVRKILQDLNGFHNPLTSFTRKQMKELLQRIREQDQMIIRTILKVCPERIHTITSGLILLYEVCKYFSVKEIIACEYGIREGYLLDRITLGGTYESE